MGNIVIATPVLSDAATLTTPGTVASTLPLSNLQTMHLSQVARWTSLSDVAIVADLGSSQAINLVALLGANWSSAAEWRVRIADTEAELTSDPTYDSTLVDIATPAFDADIEVTGRWVRIDVSDAANPDGYFEAARLYIAGGDTFWQPTLNVAEGWQLGVEDDSQIAAALSGALLPTVRNRRRVLRADFEFQSQAEIFSRAYRMILQRGIGRDLLVIRDPELTTYLADQTVYGLLAESNPIQHQTADYYGWIFAVRELI